MCLNLQSRTLATVLCNAAQLQASQPLTEVEQWEHKTLKVVKHVLVHHHACASRNHTLSQSNYTKSVNNIIFILSKRTNLLFKVRHVFLFFLKL